MATREKCCTASHARSNGNGKSPLGHGCHTVSWALSKQTPNTEKTDKVKDGEKDRHRGQDFGFGGSQEGIDAMLLLLLLYFCLK